MTMTRSLTLKVIVTISLTVAVQRSFSTQSKLVFDCHLEELLIFDDEQLTPRTQKSLGVKERLNLLKLMKSQQRQLKALDVLLDQTTEVRVSTIWERSCPYTHSHSTSHQIRVVVFPSVTTQLDHLLLHSAASGLLNSVYLLLHLGADAQYGDSWPLRSTAENGHLEVAKGLLKRGAYVHSVFDSPLRIAVKNGHTAMVGILLKNGAHVHVGEDVTLRFPIENFHVDVVRFLLQQHADVNRWDGRALAIAIHLGK